MPNIKSSIKRARQNIKRREHNKTRRTTMRTLVKKVFNADNKEEAEQFRREAESYLDRMAAKNYIHENKAARRKSQMLRHVESLEE